MSASEIRQPEFTEMTADDWREYLKKHPDRCLVVNDRRGVHTFQFDVDDGQLTFYAHGSMGYDREGTAAALDSVAVPESSDGLRVQTVEETYSGSNKGV